MPATSSPIAEAAVDGRRARRDRGRLAVTEAAIDLVLEGHIPPTAEFIAERAGVSVASIFRYFDTLDELRNETTRLYFERYAHLFDIPHIGHGAIADRIENFVSSRVSLYEATEPMARLLRWRAPQVPEMEAMLHRVRATRSDQVRIHFADELCQLTPAAAQDAVAVVSTLTSFEAWDQIRNDHARSPLQIRRAWANALTRLLKTAE